MLSTDNIIHSTGPVSGHQGSGSALMQREWRLSERSNGSEGIAKA